jgi:hypothetical protein
MNTIARASPMSGLSTMKTPILRRPLEISTSGPKRATAPPHSAAFAAADRNRTKKWSLVGTKRKRVGESAPVRPMGMGAPSGAAAQLPHEPHCADNPAKRNLAAI